MADEVGKRWSETDRSIDGIGLDCPGSTSAHKGGRHRNRTRLSPVDQRAVYQEIDATTSSITSVAPPPMDRTRASRAMRSIGLSRMKPIAPWN